MDFAPFVCKVTAETKLRGLKYIDLAKMTGYKLGTIKTFMALGIKSRPRSVRVAKALSKALNIEL